MTLQEAKNDLKCLENDLKYYEGKKEILFNKTQPGAIDYSKDVVMGGKRENRYDNYVASMEELELNNNIDLVYKQIYGLQDWIVNKLDLIGELKPLEKKIILLREEQNMIWEKIGEATGYSERQAQRIYDKYYKREHKKRSQS